MKKRKDLRRQLPGGRWLSHPIIVKIEDD